MGAAPYLAPTGLLPTSARTSGGKVTVVISWQLRASSTNHAGRATRCTNRGLRVKKCVRNRGFSRIDL